MQEAVIFQRRNRLKKHFVNVSNVLLYCYHTVSDAAKITFQIIDGFDWESKETGDSKGYVFPALETIAKIRNTSVRTIQRHILELVHATLLTRMRRKYKPSILYIEEISEEEINKYFAYFEAKSDGSEKKPKREIFIKTRNDKNDVSLKALETTKVSFAYRSKENETKENEINVSETSQQKNGDGETKKRYGLQPLADIMKRFDIVSSATVSLEEKKESGNAETGGKLKKTLGGKINTEKQQKREYLAAELATKFNDEKSLSCYRVIASKVPEDIIFQKMAEVKDSWKEGSIKKSQAAVFVGLIKKYCEKKHIELGFKYVNLL